MTRSSNKEDFSKLRAAPDLSFANRSSLFWSKVVTMIVFLVLELSDESCESTRLKMTLFSLKTMIKSKNCNFLLENKGLPEKVTFETNPHFSLSRFIKARTIKGNQMTKHCTLQIWAI